MFTFDQVFDEIKQLATDQPDTIADCVYVHTDPMGNVEPVCIVGHWLYQHHLIFDWEWEQIEETNAQTALEFAERRRGVTFDSDTKTFLSTIQKIQDQSSPWGEALELAVSEMEGSND